MVSKLKRELDYIRDLTDKLKAKYSEEDIRIAFFDGHFGFIKHYLIFLILIDSDLILDNYRFIFSSPNIKREDLAYHLNAHLNILNNQLIINSWSNFELCITFLIDAVLPTKEKERLYNHEYDKIIEILKGVELTKSQNTMIDRFKKKQLSHTPITNRCNKMLNYISDKYEKIRNIASDKEFLTFYGKLRNLIHSNAIYFGNDYSYNFKGITFMFRNGELLEQSELKDDLMFNMTVELREIYQAIIQCIEYNNEIRDPSFDLFE